jgi:predicted alpha/beta superfamily hydrolase
MRPTALALVLLLPAVAACAEEAGAPVPGYHAEKKSLLSKVLREPRPYLVALPDSYAAGDRRYPVLYVLDGAAQGLPTARAAAQLAREGAAPEVIVVAIPNPSNAARERDLTPPGMHQDPENLDSPLGQGDAFLAFLRDELIPQVESDYRTSPHRLLAGHSRGGLLVVYSLIAEPALFDVRFAHSTPLWREDDLLVKRLQTFLATAPSMKGDLFLSVGGAETERMRGGIERAAALLKEKAPAALRWWLEVTPDADHQTNAPQAIPVGLRRVFAAGS